LLSRVAPAAPPAQFYTNGEGAYAWSEDKQKNLQTVLYFAKNPTDSPRYQQLTAVIYDDKPHFVFYLDTVNRRVVGRLDLETEKFSLLAPDAQKVKQALHKFTFPTATELPRVEELFQPLPEGSAGNRQRLSLPPPTFQHPRLENSSWETSYMSADRIPIRSIMQLGGDEGTYRLQDKPGTGRLTEVKYSVEGDAHLIRGRWFLGRSNGYFRLKVPKENLNVFWGEFGFELGKTVGSWDGIRRPPGALKIEEKPVP
jgi:hypothetical protein